MQSKYMVNQQGDDALIVREDDSWFKIHEKMIKIMHSNLKNSANPYFVYNFVPLFSRLYEKGFSLEVQNTNCEKWSNF